MEKTSSFEKICVELPDSLDVLEDIYSVYVKYGHDVTINNMITNNSIYWKENILKISKKFGNIISFNDQKLIEKIFELPIIKFFDRTMLYFGLVSIDIIFLDTHLKTKFKYDENEHGSIKNFVEFKFGKEVSYIIENILKKGIDNDN